MEGLGSYGASAARPGAAGLPAVQQLPKHLRDDLEIQQLCDQERLATMLAPYVNASGELVMEAPDPDVMLFKQGLNLRLKEFEEDCRRIQQIEQKLQEKIDSAAADYEQAIHGMATATDARIFKRLREQQRQIELQQQEIDQIRFEKEILQEETKRLREISRRDAMTKRQDDRRDLRGFPQLHSAFDAERMYDGESSVLCGGSVNDNHITCGVHIFDDPKSGAPYVVPMPDTDRLLNASAPMDEEVGGADDDAQGAPDPYMQAFGGAFLALCPPPWKAAERYRKASFLDVGQSARIREAVQGPCCEN